MVERTLLAIIVVVFFAAGWWWSNRQQNTEKFFQAQLRERDTAITQLCTLALPQVRGKTPAQVQNLFKDLYPNNELRQDNGMILSGQVGVIFVEDAATGLYLPWVSAQ